MISRGISTLSHKNDGPGAKIGNGFGDVILQPSLNKRIEQLAGATANIKSHQDRFETCYFTGLLELGKLWLIQNWHISDLHIRTYELFDHFFVWHLEFEICITCSQGLDYALMTGGDVAPLGSQAVTKIHQLFQWSKKSQKGLLLFIEEADAFLCERNKTNMSEAQRSALNAHLFRMGDQSKDIVLALATNGQVILIRQFLIEYTKSLSFPYLVKKNASSSLNSTWTDTY
ncbi:hypothetical protein GIB67_017659 [Kingdonia uniflora]|uniref:ATPase AAA-type core domain-containing protein n=1 Tax=Kingdonia uniflora TaxID=39325 RepID=A0A7J7NA91_9MAGN|nr:hypothetical protein GIB67_017659 [Kingdonia uniflora]